MKKNIFIYLFAVIMCSALNSEAGFIIKKSAPAAVVTEQFAKQDNPVTITSEAASVAPEATTVAETKTKTEKHGFFSRLMHKIAKASAQIPQILYIILAIFPLGWLGMGINDNFTGTDWLISLLLYIIFWVPGIIFTLIKMNKYYK